MKCRKCFFCVRIGKGIVADYPVKYCKRTQQYLIPVIIEDGIRRPLDFKKTSDCKMWDEFGCDIHPSTVAKAKRDSIERMMREEE